MMDGYTRIAIELLHLLRYICVNGIGLRKLLKKYDKIMAGVEHNSNSGPDNHHHSSIHQHRPADHIQQLANAASISAIHASLESALQQQQQQSDTTTTHNEEAPILRLQCALDAIAILREYAVIVNQPFSEFLSHRAMIVTGDRGQGGEERKALLMLLQFEPETLAVISEQELLAWKRASSQKNQNQTATTVGAPP